MTTSIAAKGENFVKMTISRAPNDGNFANMKKIAVSVIVAC